MAPGTTPDFRNIKKLASVVLTAVSPAASAEELALIVVVMAPRPVVPPKVANSLAFAMVVEAPTAVKPAEANIIKRLTTCHDVLDLSKNLALPPHSDAVCSMAASAQALLITPPADDAPPQGPVKLRAVHSAWLFATNSRLLRGALMADCAKTPGAVADNSDAINTMDNIEEPAVVFITLTSVIAHSAFPRGRGGERGAGVHGHLKKQMLDVARLVEMHHALGERFDLVARKNEPILSRIVWNSFSLMHFQYSRGTLQLALLLALLLAPAIGLNFAEVFQGFLKLAGKPLAVQAEGGEFAVGIDDIEIDGGLIGRWVSSAVEQGGLQRGDAVETPGSIDEFLGELGLGRRGWLVFLKELAAMALVGGGIFGSEDGIAAGEAMGEGIQGRTLFSGGGAGSGGEKGVGAVRAIARRGRVGICHKTSVAVFA
jgi:hypothetical protein